MTSDLILGPGPPQTGETACAGTISGRHELLAAGQRSGKLEITWVHRD
jgi:hypothetical protein